MVRSNSESPLAYFSCFELHPSKFSRKAIKNWPDWNSHVNFFDVTRVRRPSGAGSDERAQDLGFALHDVSNALTVVLGWLDVVRNRLPEGVDREALDVARTHARL